VPELILYLARLSKAVICLETGTIGLEGTSLILASNKDVQALYLGK